MSKKPALASKEKSGLPDEPTARLGLDPAVTTLPCLDFIECSGGDLQHSMVVADELMEKLYGRIDEAITVIETVKKIPDYNADLSVELAISCTQLKCLQNDQRLDDNLLESDEEPKSLGRDNCMSEAIEIQPQPILNIGEIDVGTTISHFKTVVAKVGKKIAGNNKRMSTTFRQKSKFQRQATRLNDKIDGMRKMSNVIDENDDLEDSPHNSDDGKSMRSKRSMSMHSTAKHKDIKMKHSFHGSQKSTSKRERRSNISKLEELPQPSKLNLPERKLHNDDLTEQHFIELRQFLHKKQRQEAIAAKMNAKGRGGSYRRPTKTMSLVEDFEKGHGIDREIDVTPQGNSSPVNSGRPVMSKAGQKIEFSVKERTQCMENDRFLITRKVNVANLPDPNSQQAQIQDPSTIKTTIEKSAYEVHEEYMKRIEEMRAKRKQEEEAKRLAEQQESMIRNFTKKPNVNTNPASEAGDLHDASASIAMKRNSKGSNNRQATPHLQSVNHDDDDYQSVGKIYRPETPEIKEDVLQGFDMRKQKIASLFVGENKSIDLTQESKPVRETLKANYGVIYKENINDGGSANVTLNGESYYASPGRTMRKDELGTRQQRERASKAQDYKKSRNGEFISPQNENEASSNTTSRNNRYQDKKRDKQEALMAASDKGDSLYQPSVHSKGGAASTRIDLPIISRNPQRTLDSYHTSSTRHRSHRPVRDQITTSGHDQIHHLKLFDKGNSAKIEVRDGGERPVFSPKTGVTFMNGLNSVFDWQAETFDMTDGKQPRHQTSMGPYQGRPISQRQLGARKSPRVINRSIRLKDDLASAMRSSADRSSNMNGTGVGFNFGTIMNYKKADGINDQSLKGSFRKWTGMPQTTRVSKMPAMALNHAKVMADHRKKTVYPADLQASFDSSVVVGETKQRNISQTAWNKIRMVELKKKDRLNFNP